MAKNKNFYEVLEYVGGTTIVFLTCFNIATETLLDFVFIKKLITQLKKKKKKKKKIYKQLVHYKINRIIP